MVRFKHALVSAFLFTVGCCAQVPDGGQATYGDCSPIFNGSGNSLNCFPKPRHVVLTGPAKSEAIAHLNAKPGKIKFTYLASDPEVDQFVTELKSFFHETDWTTLDKEEFRVAMSTSPMVGVTIEVHGDPLPTGQTHVGLDNSTPGGCVAILLLSIVGRNGVRGVIVNPKLPEDTVYLTIGSNPKPQ